MEDKLDTIWTEIIYDSGNFLKSCYPFFWDATPCHWIIGARRFGTTESRNIGNQWRNDAASYSRRMETAAEAPRKLKNPATFGVIRENHEKRVKKGGVSERVGARGAVCIDKEETPWMFSSLIHCTEILTELKNVQQHYGQLFHTEFKSDGIIKVESRGKVG